MAIGGKRFAKSLTYVGGAYMLLGGDNCCWFSGEVTFSGSACATLGSARSLEGSEIRGGLCSRLGRGWKRLGGERLADGSRDGRLAGSSGWYETFS